MTPLCDDATLRRDRIRPHVINSAASAWNPLSLGNQRFWVDAPSLGLSDNDPIEDWTDRFGILDFSQPVLSKRPTLKTGIRNGNPAAYFDGGDWISSANTSDLNDVDGDFTFWAGFQFSTVAPSVFALFMKGAGSGAATAVFELLNWSGYQALYWQSGVGPSPALMKVNNSEDTSWHYAVIHRTGSSWSYRLDGVEIATATLAGSINDTTHIPTIGAYAGGSSPMTGYVGEVGMVAEAAGSNLPTIEEYLSGKWGTP